MGATEKIARFIVENDYEDIPRDAVEKAKRTTLDCMGVALAGVAEPVSQTITGYVTKLGGPPRHPYLTLASKFRFKTLPWPMASLPTPWTTMTVV
jgi:2-methylcitrate dehydratase PrpD